MRGFGTRLVAMGIAGLFYLAIAALILGSIYGFALFLAPAGLPHIQFLLTIARDVAVIVAYFIPIGISVKLLGKYILREPSYMDIQNAGNQYIGLPTPLRSIINRFGAF